MRTFNKQTKRSKKNPTQKLWVWRARKQRPAKVVAEAVAAGPAEIPKSDRRGFFGCYLLTSLSPRYKGHSYIGFTVNPKRRIRQHNGEITSGAHTTKKKRPWEMLLCIHGFPDNVTALQFEWAWQHPTESVAVREAAATLKSLGGLANKIRLAFTMLTLPSWHSLNLTVSFFSTKYMKHTAVCPTLPSHKKVHFCPMDQLPCYCHPSDYPNGDDPYDHYDGDGDDGELHNSSHLGDQSTSFQDDPHVPSAEIDCSSDDILIRGIQDAGIHSWALDSKATSGSRERESSSARGYANPVADEQQFHQLLPCTARSAVNSVIRHLQHGEDNWVEKPTIPSSVSGIKEPLHQAHPSEAESSSSPVLTELFFQLPEGGRSSSRNNTTKEMQTQLLRDSFPILKRHVKPLCRVERESFSEVADVCVSGNFSKRYETIYILLDESSGEDNQITNEQPLLSVDESVHPSPMNKIEVIDLFTPSPDCRKFSCSKKRRVASDSVDIIDLTRSPLFVQL